LRECNNTASSINVSEECSYVSWPYIRDIVTCYGVNSYLYICFVLSFIYLLLFGLLNSHPQARPGFSDYVSLHIDMSQAGAGCFARNLIIRDIFSS